MIGSPTTGWVWSNNAGLHIQKPNGEYQNIERYRNYRLFGTGYVLLGSKYQPANDSTSILTVELQYDPPRVRATNYVSHGDYDWLNIDASASYFFAATKKGLEVRDLHTLNIKQIWPGSFRAVVALSNDCASCLDARNFQVVTLNQNEGRWNPNSFFIEGLCSISASDFGFFLRQSYCKTIEYYWCPKHQHIVNMPVNYDLRFCLRFCNGNEHIYTARRCPETIDIFSSRQHLLLWRLRADDLVVTDTHLACMRDNRVFVVPRRLWARRLLFLTRTVLPTSIIMKIKEKI